MPAKQKVTVETQFSIERIIRLWEGKFTWAALIKAVEIELGLKVTRQTLEDYKGIYTAYKQKKEMLRGVDPKFDRSIVSSDVKLKNRLDKLLAEIELKDQIINEQKRFLQRLMQNAAEIPALKGNIDALFRQRSEDKD
ncbi:hypothetical protein RT723_01735 [Psychrosphaera aquimarina]|uniref:Uncharacterized protein n=1 Tax=Psychrosphaera aquimarina TaxID=2044854 RepID=A0ABU3QWE5_9GAMM|nr:hypothetical protein [Psychrosphaera aquimarina]MDU0111750.1 hypothetical protein [Psychrosphaera aquimarina]